jgi:hypothetical protein
MIKMAWILVYSGVVSTHAHPTFEDCMILQKEAGGGKCMQTQVFTLAPTIDPSKIVKK